jgi:predicted MFS family arabinose efflux permease
MNTEAPTAYNNSNNNNNDNNANPRQTNDAQTDKRRAMRKEYALLATLALVQFTAVVDFLVMAPLGPKLMSLWGITTQEFGAAVSAYVLTAGICGFIAAFFIDKFDRKRLLTIVFAGFTVGTFACGLSPNYPTLLAARVLTGVFGGVIGTMVFAIIADAVPVERRGRAFGIATASFSLASIFGVPGGLYFANLFHWHAPFLILGALGIAVQVLIALFVPNLTAHLSGGGVGARRNPLAILGAIRSNPNQMRALFLVFCLAVGQFSVLPFLTPYLVTNVEILEEQLPLIYFIGGLCTVVTSPLIGTLADKYDKRRIYTVAAIVSIAPIALITNFELGVSTVLVFTASSLMFVTINGRMIPSMAMIQGTVTPQMRGSFTSISTSVQQISSGVATFIAGFFIHKGASGLLINYNLVGWIAIVFTIISIGVIHGIAQIETPPSTERRSGASRDGRL